jgi:gas vesicle protein
MSEHDWDFIKGMVIGGLLGAAIGILFAPKSGRETRQDLALKTDELLAKAKREYERAVEESKAVYEATVRKIQEAEEVAAQKAEDLENMAGEFVKMGTGKLAEGTERLKKAFEAGLEAYHEEKKKETPS